MFAATIFVFTIYVAYGVYEDETMSVIFRDYWSFVLAYSLASATLSLLSAGLFRKVLHRARYVVGVDVLRSIGVDESLYRYYFYGSVIALVQLALVLYALVFSPSVDIIYLVALAALASSLATGIGLGLASLIVVDRLVAISKVLSR